MYYLCSQITIKTTKLWRDFSDDFSDNDFNSLNEEIERVINKIDNFLNEHNL